MRYLICRDICIPKQTRLELSLRVKSGAAALPADQLFRAARARLPRPAPPSWKISAASIGDEFVLDLKTGKSTEAPQFFPLHAEQIENAAPQDVTASPGGIRLHLKKSNHLLESIPRLEGVFVLASGKAYLVDVRCSQSPGVVTRMQTVIHGGDSEAKIFGCRPGHHTLIFSSPYAREGWDDPRPEFQATDSNGHVHKLSGYRGKFVVLEWHNNG